MTDTSPTAVPDGRSATRFEALGVMSRLGTHVTPQAGVDLFGRYWTTTSRSSLKIRSVSRLPVASVTRSASIGGAPRIEMSAGRARVLDPRSPSTAIDDPFAASVVGLVAGRIAVDHIDELVGYGAIARDVPSPWALGGRVLLSVSTDETLVANGLTITHATGRWATEHDLPPVRRRNRVAPVRLDTNAAAEAHRFAHAAWHDDTVALRCSVGVATPIGPVAMPAEWDHDHGSAVVRRDLLARLEPDITVGACITLDGNADRRADEKVGVMLRGVPSLRALPKSHRLADDHIGVVVEPERVTWWFGFMSGTSASRQRSVA